jgi:hypothetical protein
VKQTYCSATRTVGVVHSFSRAENCSGTISRPPREFKRWQGCEDVLVKEARPSGSCSSSSPGSRAQRCWIGHIDQSCEQEGARENYFGFDNNIKSNRPGQPTFGEPDLRYTATTAELQRSKTVERTAASTDREQLDLDYRYCRQELGESQTGLDFRLRIAAQSSAEFWRRIWYRCFISTEYQ